MLHQQQHQVLLVCFISLSLPSSSSLSPDAVLHVPRVYHLGYTGFGSRSAGLAAPVQHPGLGEFFDKILGNAAGRKAPLDGFGFCICEGIAGVLPMAGFDDLAGEVQLERAMHWLREGQVDPAVASYKSFKPRSPSLVLRAATNLSFIFLLEGDLEQAATYAGMAVAADRCAGHLPFSAANSRAFSPKVYIFFYMHD